MSVNNLELKYKIVPTSIAVIPECEPIYSELTTFIDIDDEADGPFIVIRQELDGGTQKIRFDIDEWPLIQKAINRMMRNCEKLKW